MSPTIFSILSLAALASLAPTALAQSSGTATILNSCPFPIYLQHIDQLSASPLLALAPGGSYSEPISTNPGVALTIWNSPDQSQPDTELDYNLVPSGQYQGLYFGLGVSQGAVSAFETFGFGVSPVLASGGDGGVNCGGLWCEAGNEREVCESVGVTNTCTTDAGLEFVLCSDDGAAGAK